MIRITIRTPPLAVQRAVAEVNLQIAYLNMLHAREALGPDEVLAYHRQRAHYADRIAILTLEIASCK